MVKIGIFFGSMSGNTRLVAEMIHSKLSDHEVSVFDIFETSPHEIDKFDNLIFGAPSWGKMELHEDWRKFLRRMKKVDLSNKKIALFGLGDQIMFSNAFADSIGILYDELKDQGCQIVGNWKAGDYMFKKSHSLNGDKFLGLVIDEDNQSELTENRIDKWLNEILPHFS